MRFNLIALVSVMAMTRAAFITTPFASAIAVAQPSATFIRAEPYDPNPQYSHSYSVTNSLSGDNKAQAENRDGNVVQGSYNLEEPDGSRRTVSHAANPINGFNAIVQKDSRYNVHHAVATSTPVLRTAVIAHPAQIVIREPILTETRSHRIIATTNANANANVLRQSTVINNALPYSAPQLVGVGIRRDSLYNRHTIFGNVGYNYENTDLVKVV